MAMACFRLLTVPPLPPFPLFNVPRLNLRISRSTSLDALFEYFRTMRLLHADRDRLRLRRGTPHDVCHERDQKQNEKDEEQDLRDSRRCSCDAAKTQGAGDECNDQKHKGPVEHDQPPVPAGRKSFAQVDRLNTASRMKFQLALGRPRELGG